MKNKNTHKDSQNKTSKESASFQSGAKTTNPFSVPADYFETLPTQIQERIAESKRIPFFTKLSIHIKQPVYSISISGIAAIIFIAILFFYNSDRNQDLQIPAFTLEEILNSEPEIIFEMSESQLIEALMAENDYTDNMESFSGFATEKDTSISDDDIIEYLSDEELNETFIYNL